MKIELSPIERKALKAEAHGLDPVVLIGNEGLTPAVLREIGRALDAHELIKVRAATDVREDRVTWLETICDQLDAAPIQHIGKILVVYRENPDKKPVTEAKPAKRRGPRLTKRQEQDKALGVKKPKGAQRFKPEPKAKPAPKGRPGGKGRSSSSARTTPFGKPAPKGDGARGTGGIRKPAFGGSRKPATGGAGGAGAGATRRRRTRDE